MKKNQPAYKNYGRLFAFYLLAYGITWIIWSPYYLPVFPPSWRDMPVFHFAGSYGPMLAALACLYFFNGSIALRQFLKQLFSLRSFGYILLALSLPFIILIVSLLLSGQDLAIFQWQSIWYNKELGMGTPLIWALINIGVYGLGEETGWRGYALPYLQKHHSAFAASVIVAVLWAVWHWPLFFYRHCGYYTMDTVSVIGWLFSLITGSVILTWLFNSSKGSILACIVFHGSMEVAFTTGASAAVTAQVSGVIVTVTGVLILVFAKPSNLSAKPRIRMSDEGYQSP